MYKIATSTHFHHVILYDTHFQTIFQVGEVRCNKEVGPVFQKWLTEEALPGVASKIKVYEDTKIRLHFSTFRVLPESRDTCFLDNPHQCPEFAMDNGLHRSLHSLQTYSMYSHFMYYSILMSISVLSSLPSSLGHPHLIREMGIKSDEL